MVELLQARALVPIDARTRTAKFEGENYGAGASFFYVDNDPGQGTGLHWHPYSETWVVHRWARPVRRRRRGARGD